MVLLYQLSTDSPFQAHQRLAILYIYSSLALYLNHFIIVKTPELGIPVSQISSSENHTETAKVIDHWTKHTHK